MNRTEKMRATTTEMGSLDWFTSRAFASLKPISRYDDHTIWDYTDSACLWGPGSAEAYAKLQDRSSYGAHVTDPETKFITSKASEIVKKLPGQLIYVDLGPGTAEKEKPILEEMQRQGKDIIYVPVDINKNILDAASSRYTKLGVTSIPIQSTFEELDVSSYLRSKINDFDGRSMFVSLGLTFINYRPEVALEMLRRIMGKGGYAFITAELQEGVNIEEIKAAYSDPIVQDFIQLKLNLLGIKDTDIQNTVLTNDVLISYILKTVPEQLQAKGVSPGDEILTIRTYRHPLKRLREFMDETFETDYFLDNVATNKFAAVLLHELR